MKKTYKLTSLAPLFLGGVSITTIPLGPDGFRRVVMEEAAAKSFMSVGYVVEDVAAPPILEPIPAPIAALDDFQIRQGNAFRFATFTELLNYVASNLVTTPTTPTTPGDTTIPTLTSASVFSIAENVAFSTTLVASESVTFSKGTGNDAALFTLTGNVLSLAAQDYENTNHAPVYSVPIRMEDAAGNVGTQLVTLNITNVLEGTRAVLSPTSATMLYNVASGTKIFDFANLVEGESRAIDVSWLSFDASGDVFRNANTGPASSPNATTITATVTSRRAGESDVLTALTITIPATVAVTPPPTGSAGTSIFSTTKPSSVNVFADLAHTTDQAEVIDTSTWEKQNDAAVTFSNGQAIATGAQTTGRYVRTSAQLRATGRRMTSSTYISSTTGSVSIGSSNGSSSIAGGKTVPGRYMSNAVITDGTLPFKSMATIASGSATTIESIHIFDLDAMMAKPQALYLIISQSNFVGNAAVTDPALDIPAYGCVAIPGGGNTSRGWTTDANGLGLPGLCVDPVMHTLINTGGGPTGAMMREIRKLYPESITPVVVATGANGAGFGGNGLWNKDGTTRTAYENAWRQWRGAWAAAPAGSFIAGIIFCQGEADIGSAQRLEHQTRVHALLNEIHAEPGWTGPKGSSTSFGRIPIVVAEIGYNLDPAVQDAANISNVNAMIAMQKNWATGSGDAYSLPRCEYVPRPADATFMPDNVHYDQRSYRNIGFNVAQAFGRLTFPLG